MPTIQAPSMSPDLNVSEVAGLSLYLARHTLGNRTPMLVLAASATSARVRAAAHWRLVFENVSADLATEDEAGRHQSVLTKKGAVPVEKVFRALAAVR